MGTNWRDVHKKIVTVDGKNAFAVYFYPRHKHKMPLRMWMRLKFAEWLITPFLLTNDEVGDVKL